MSKKGSILPEYYHEELPDGVKEDIYRILRDKVRFRIDRGKVGKEELIDDWLNRNNTRQTIPEWYVSAMQADI